MRVCKSKFLYRQNAVTLISLVVTIIILLILIGITLKIINDIIINKAILASNNTKEVYIKEKINMSIMSCYISYEEIKLTTDLTKEEFLKENLLKEIANNIDIENGELEIKDDIIKIKFIYQIKEYTLLVSLKDETINFEYELNGNVSLGDYVNYPVEYIDVYSKEKYTSLNGWRVIDDGKMEGTSGIIKLISTGIPAKWYYKSQDYSNNEDVLNCLNNNFEKLQFYGTTANTQFEGSVFKNEIATKITVLSLNEFNCAYNKLNNANRGQNDSNNFEYKNDLFFIDNIDACYWLATSVLDNSMDLYYINLNEIAKYDNTRLGIRPVIWLKENQKGVYDVGIWKINN